MKTDYLKVNDDIKLYLPRMTFVPAIFKIIESQRTYLSPYVPMAYTSKTEEDIKNVVKSIQITNQAKRSLITYLFYKEELIGSLGFVQVDHKHASAELGYWISKDFQGQGIISTSCQRLIDYGFKHLGFNRISIKIVPDNEKSLGIPKRLGFEREGISRAAFKVGEKFNDLVVFSLLANDKDRSPKTEASYERKTSGKLGTSVFGLPSSVFDLLPSLLLIPQAFVL